MTSFKRVHRATLGIFCAGALAALVSGTAQANDNWLTFGPVDGGGASDPATERDRRWAAFVDLISSPRLPSGLAR